MSACPQCGTEIPANGTYCPDCGQSASNSKRVPASGRDRILAAISYFFIPAVIFIFLHPFKRIHFIRFHAFQSLFTWIAMVAVAGVIKAVSMLLLLIPSFGPLITFLLLILYGLAGPILLLLLSAKATMSEEFELPIIGHIAQKQAGNL